MPVKYTRQPIYVIGPSIAYLPLTRGQYSCVDWDEAAWLAQWNWVADPDQYEPDGHYRARRGGFVNGKYTSVYMSVELAKKHGLDISQQIDHINRNREDNRLANLRPCTPSQNVANTARRNKCGFKGVFRAGKRFRGRCCKNGVAHDTATYATPQEAHLAYRELSARLHGEYACAEMKIRA